LFIPTQARSRMRVLVSASAIGTLAALALGASYMGGSLARTMTVKAKAARLSVAAEADYSNASLVEAAGGLDPSAQAIAERHDRYAVAGAAQRDRASTGMAARLERMDARQREVRVNGLLRASMNATTAAQPFRMAGALDASRDLDCLAQAVYYEARGEGTSGMQAVAQVVLNRVRHPAFPKSVCGVVYQGAALRTGCQFSFVCDGSMRRGKEPGAWRRARDVASRALGGYVFTMVGNATHFHTTGVSPGWRNQLLRVAQVGSHVFYRFGGSAGSSGAFRYTPRPSTGMDTTRPVFASVVPTPRADDSPARPYKILFNDGADRTPTPAEQTAAAPAAKPEDAKPVQAAAAPAPGATSASEATT
jgi:spore germination cell wall hydrolase CwlJ-like protein